MATFKDKISQLINNQVPEFVVEQHPKFLEFVKTYYTFMESAELDVTSVQTTDGIQLETETAQNNELLLDGSRIDSDRTQLNAGDKIILESSAFGKFTRGETITGQTSGATTTVLAEDLNNSRLFISAQDKFIIGETVLGASSNASARSSRVMAVSPLIKCYIRSCVTFCNMYFLIWQKKKVNTCMLKDTASQPLASLLH